MVSEREKLAPKEPKIIGVKCVFYRYRLYAKMFGLFDVFKSRASVNFLEKVVRFVVLSPHHTS